LEKGVAKLILRMFLRKLKNRSGSTSIQIISKERGEYKVIKTIGTSNNEQEVQKLVFPAKQEIERLNCQSKLFVSESDFVIEQAFEALGNASIRTIGPEIIFGKIYDSIGFNKIKEELFRHLVIARLSFPLNKLKTIEYLYRFQGVMLDIDAVYRFLDKLSIPA
jgi:hypothetical protein